MSELNVNVETLSPVVRRLQIQVPAERVTEVTDIVYARLSRTVKLKGYRQGHVPRRVLEKHFADRVKTDVAREIVDVTFSEALGTTRLSPVAAPTVEPEELRLGQSFRYTARVEVQPTIDAVDFKGLEVTVPEVKVEDAQVDAQLEQLREAMSSLVPIEGREIAEPGDVASVSYEVEFLGTGRPAQSRDDALVRVEAGLFIDGHGEKLVGQKVGEERSFEETIGEDAADELKGKIAKTKVTVRSLKTRELPALDDDFAKDVGGDGSTLEELRARIRADLQLRADAENSHARREALLKALRERNPLEVPPAMVDDRAGHLANDFVDNLARRGMRIDAQNPVVDQFKKDVTPRAMDDVKSHFLLDAIARTENLEVTSEDLQTRLVRSAAAEGVPVEKFLSRFRTPQALADVAASIRNDKAFKLVEDTARVTTEPAKASIDAQG